jgi:hypothetical protein
LVLLLITLLVNMLGTAIMNRTTKTLRPRR